MRVAAMAGGRAAAGCVSSARLRCAWALWAVAGRPPGLDLFPSGVSPAPAGRVSGARLSARPGVATWPPARGVCSSRGGGGGGSDSVLKRNQSSSV